jgi:hypothetical protein
MANIDVPQDEANRLIDAEKLYTGPDLIQYPGASSGVDLPCESINGPEEFQLSVFRGKIDLRKVSHNLRVRTSIILLRLEINASPHENPDGTKVSGTHLHVYQEGYHDAWAYELSDDDFPNTDDLRLTLRDFMDYSNITGPPNIEGDLF